MADYHHCPGCKREPVTADRRRQAPLDVFLCGDCIHIFCEDRAGPRAVCSRRSPARPPAPR